MASMWTEREEMFQENDLFENPAPTAAAAARAALQFGSFPTGFLMTSH